MKALGSTQELHPILTYWSFEEVSGIFSVEVIFVDTKRNTDSEGSLLVITDAEVRKRGERTGLDTLVVHAVNDEC